MSEQIFHIGIKGLVSNERGEILLLSLSSPSFGKKAERWDIPGGRMNPGESFETALRREIKEELGLVYDTEPIFLMATLTNIRIKTEVGEVGLVLMIYSLDLPSNSEIKLSSEHVGYQWVEENEAISRLNEKYSNEFAKELRQRLTQ